MSAVDIGWSNGPAEREARLDVIRSAWLGAFAGIFSRDEMEAVFTGKAEAGGDWTARRLAPAGTLAARRGSRVVGLAALALLENGDGELAALYVRPDEQRAGIGSQLWDAACAELASRGCERMEVWTLARSAARAFYESRGCRSLGTGTFELAGHREAAAGYVVSLTGICGSHSGQSTPAQ